MKAHRVVHVLVAAAFFFLLSQAATAEPVQRREIGEVVLENVPEIPAALRERMNQYLNVRSASLLDFDDAGERILISTRFGNTDQLHIVSSPMGAREQITFFDEPVRSGRFLPGTQGRKIVYLMDRGGTENNQVYLLNLDNGTSLMLTDGKSRNERLVVAPDGKRIAFASTARNGRDTDIWLAEGPDFNPKIALQATGAFYPEEFNRDGSGLTVSEYISEKVSYLHIFDTTTGKTTSISPKEDKFAYGGGQFSPDGKHLFYTTDKAGQFHVLYRRDLATGQDTPITASLPWDIEGIAVSPAGDSMAFAANEDGASKLYVMDPMSASYQSVSGIPLGIIGGLEFSNDGKRLGLSMQTPTGPSDVYVMPRGGKLARWTQSEIGGLNPARFVAPERIAFPTFDQAEGKPRMIPAYYYKPEGKGPFPVIINIHGGPEGQERPRFISLSQFWATEQKFAVIVPNVRGSTGYGRDYHMLDDGFNREDSVKDIGALLDWIAKRPELDSKRVAVYGGSYGGYMVLACLTNYADRIKAGVDIVGIANFITFLEKTSPYRQDLRRVEYGDERDAKMREHLTRISPLNSADKIKSALFVQHGANDPRVPAYEAEQIVKKMRDNGRTVWYFLAKNEGHGFAKKENRDLALLSAVMFLDDQLKN